MSGDNKKRKLGARNAAMAERAIDVTSPARPDSVGGTSMPSAFAVLRLMTNSNLVDCTTGKAAGA